MISWRFSLTMALPLLLGVCGEEVEVMSGISTEYLPLPTIYQTFVPILLEYKLPTYSKENMSTLTWLSGNCTSSAYEPNSVCPTAFYLSTEVNDFLSYLDEMNPKDSDMSNEILKFGQDNEDLIVPTMNWNNLDESIENFKNIRTVSRDQIEEYLTTTIKNPSVTVYYMSRNIEYFSQDNNIKNIRNMLNGFRSAYWDQINSDRIDEALLSNAISLYQSMVFQRYLMESFRWSQAESECRHENLIPKTIVSRGKVANALRNLSIQLNNYSYSLSIPEDQLQRYFSEKLTSCVFTQDSLVVTIRVPVHRLQDQIDNLKFLQVYSIPFVHPTDNYNVCEVKIQNYPQYFHDITTGLVQTSRCKSNQLCLMSSPEFSDYSLNDPCISTILLVEEEDLARSIVKNCPLSCKNVKEYRYRVQGFPWIKKISNDTFVLTGQPEGSHKSAILRCPGEDKVISIFDFGASLINVPKWCEIVVENGKSFTLSPQEEDLDLYSYSQVHQIIPIHWTNNDVLSQFPIERLNMSVSNVNDEFASAIQTENGCGGGGSHIFILTFLCLMLAFFVTAFIYLYREIRNLKMQLSYGSDHYKEFVAYKNGTVRCNLLESY